MKKIIAAVFAVYAVFALAACASGGAASSASGGSSAAVKTIPLDQAIREAAAKIEDNVQAGQIIAVLNFTSPAEQFSEYVIDDLSGLLVNGKKLVVVDRKELDVIRQEEQYQLSGEVSDESARAIGKKLGAQFVVSGSLNSLGNAYRFRIRVLNVESAVVEADSSADLNPRETRVTYLLSGEKPAGYNAVSPGFVRVEGGTFQMGSSNGREDEKPVHSVTVSGFSMGRYEVTQKEWVEVMGSNPSRFLGDNLPVERVSWYDALEYCNKRSLKEGLTPAYNIDKNQKDSYNQNQYDDLKWTVSWNQNANGYRLPTEAEWEYAAKGGNGSPGNYDYSGSNNVDEVAWHYGNSTGSTQEAGAKKPNSLGLYDMSGNVSEWCWDWYGNYSGEVQTDPRGSFSGAGRVGRGGSWYFVAQYARSAYRFYADPSSADGVIGFRLVRP